MGISLAACRIADFLDRTINPVASSHPGESRLRTEVTQRLRNRGITGENQIALTYLSTNNLRVSLLSELSEVEIPSRPATLSTLYSLDQMPSIEGGLPSQIEFNLSGGWLKRTIPGFHNSLLSLDVDKGSWERKAVYEQEDGLPSDFVKGLLPLYRTRLALQTLGFIIGTVAFAALVRSLDIARYDHGFPFVETGSVILASGIVINFFKLATSCIDEMIDSAVMP